MDELSFEIIVETKEGLHILLGAASNRQHASVLADSLFYGGRQHYQAIYVRDMSDPRKPMLMDIWPESHREPEKHKHALERYRKQFGLSIDRKEKE